MPLDGVRQKEHDAAQKALRQHEDIVAFQALMRLRLGRIGWRAKDFADGKSDGEQQRDKADDAYNVLDCPFLFLLHRNLRE